MDNAAPIPRTELLRYGLLALPLAFAGMPLYIHAPDFYATHHGVSLTLIGILLLAIRAFDAIQDPLLGLLSDRYRNYRLPLMLGGMLLLAGGFYLLFHPHPGSEAWYFVLGMVLATTAFSHLSINLNTIGGVWSQVPHTQTRITTTREALGLTGLMLAALTPTLLQRIESPDAAFHHFSLLLAALLVIAAFVFSGWYCSHRDRLQSASLDIFSGATLSQALQSNRRLYTIYAASVTASAIPAVLVLFFIRDRLDGENWAGLFLLLYFLAGVAAMPLWQAFARHFSKQTGWLAAMGLAIVSFIWAYFLQSGDLISYGIICIASGMALGAELALPPALLAEKVTHQHASVQFAILTFLSKSALALAAGLSLPLLEVAGYQPGARNSTEALQALSFTYALLPCLLKLVAATLLWRWIRTETMGVHHETHSLTSTYRGHHVL